MSSKHDRIPLPTPARLRDELRLSRPPFWMVSILAILVALTFLPLALIVYYRHSKKPFPRIHIFQDMGNQPRYNPQAASPIFQDGRAMRPPVPGTVARGQQQEDEHLERGYRPGLNPQGAPQPEYFTGYPAGIDLSPAFLRRGQTLFGIYCAPCHGLDGYGTGPIHQRAIQKEEPKWIPPTNLHSDEIRARAEGHLYNTIKNGIRNMPAYGPQIDTPDRWAIVAYVRALQLSQHAPLEAVPPEQRGILK